MIILLGAVGTLFMVGWKTIGKRNDEQLEWMRDMSGKLEEQGLMLREINVRVEGLDDIKRKQEHDHKAIRDLDKLTEQLKIRVNNLEDSIENIKSFCIQEHGNRIDPTAKRP